MNRFVERLDAEKAEFNAAWEALKARTAPERLAAAYKATRESAGQVDADGPEPDARPALGGEADSADALLALDHGIVANTDRAELQHILRAFLAHNTAPAESVGWAALAYAPGT